MALGGRNIRTTQARQALAKIVKYGGWGLSG
jgi:hypothetical protein